MPTSVMLAFLVLFTVMPGAASAQVRVQRFTLVIGANFGGTERPRLQYAVTDAERFARVLVELGGVRPEDEIILRQPKLRDLIEGFDRLSTRVADARRTAGKDGRRIEVLVYYSGHADEQGLLIGDDRYSYRSLRERLDQIPSDVRIAVLDACASGAFTRIKSGRLRPPFMVDAASNMRGHAFLTSSAATEAAQESDRIRASFFTHYLVSGFRGAADLSGDGRVTLNEAYQFAFSETLGRTVDTKAGPQHPSYDINLSGTGDIVMTDIRQTTATIVLGEDLDGRFFIRNARKELIVELYKPRGRRIELGVEAGTYEVRLEARNAALIASAVVAGGAHVVIEPRQFGRTALESTRRRGGPDPPRLAVDGRNRLSARWSGWPESSSTAASGARGRTVLGGLEYTRYIREDLSIAVLAQELRSGNAADPVGPLPNVVEVFAMPVSLRWHPLRARPNDAIKPFATAGVGPAFVVSARSFAGADGARVLNDARSQTTIGGHAGIGVDFHLARSFSVSVSGGYHWMGDFAEPVGERRNYSRPEFGVSVGWLFGRGRTK